MAEGAGPRMNWARKALVNLALKAAGFPGMSRTLGLTDPSGWDRFGGSTASGKNVDESSAMQVSTVWACVRILAETLGSLPWAIYRRDDKGNMQRADDHPLTETLINSPNSDQTSVEFRQAMMTNLGLRGNAFALIERGAGGRVNALTPVEPLNVTVKRRKTGELWYEVNDNGKPKPYAQDQVWHLKTFSRDGIVGLSPIGAAREAMGFALGLEEFGARLFSNGLLSGTIVEFPGWVPDEKRALVEGKLQRMYNGLANAGKPFLAEAGMKVTKGMLPPEEAQFLELRGFGVDEICRFYRIPPHMVARLDRATNNNIEQLSLEFVMYTMLPYLTLWEHSASKWLLRPEDRSKFFLRFNFEGLLRADANARAGLYSILLQNGVLSRNEVRALENRNQVDEDGMDDHTVQSNMISVDDLKLIADAMRAKRTGQGGTA